ncbi:hypothetical protein E0Z10_g448 [Xylaria hypoxylon]|uniref:Protein kinase domain-containing protein n=1 Tax=Xylaria hypoxylon TaxID=37992 RepID=A0A4Z0ZBG6_9PEZI|nr:hypothetical protein E0Z10_g448 [Xylaria hypoxylon]
MSTETKIDTEIQHFTNGALNQGGEDQVNVASTGSNEAEETEEEDIEYYGIGYDHVENVQLYNKGGHHPVHLGDVLNNRYEVVHKLGSGGFGLVWLGQDAVTNKWRAIKIMTAEYSTEGKEEKIYNHLLQRSSFKELEENHFLIPLEQFWIEGPNGRHHCIVLPVLGPTASSWRTEILANNSGQITEDSGVCHGDLKPDNVMMEVKGLDGLSKAEILELLGEPETCEVETESGKPPSPRAPEYIVLPPWDAWWEGITTSSPAIIDFGASYLTSDPPEVNGMSLSYAAPEVIWEKTFRLGPHSDIWSLAATIYQIVYDGTMFSGDHINSTVRSFEFFLGSLPEPYRSVRFEEWCAANRRHVADQVNKEERDQSQSIDEARWERLPVKWEYKSLLESRAKLVAETGYSDHFEAALGNERQFYPNITSKDDLTDEERYKVVKYKLPREDVVEIADLLQKMVRYDPTKRMTIDEVSRHNWLGNSPKSSVVASDIKSQISPKNPLGVISTLLIVLVAYAFQSKFR